MFFNSKDFPLYTALVTPFKENGEVDFEDLLTLMRGQETAGVGILILGSTGEALNLSLEERKEIISTIAKEKFNVPLMVGVGGIHLPSTIEWVKYLEGFNFDSYLLVTPLYAKPGDEGQIEWFKALLNTASRPCVLYNVPGRTGCPLSIRAVSELSTHPNFWAIKEASASVETFTQYKEACKSQEMFCGDDGLMPSFAKAGASGLISVASNLWPVEVLEYVKRSLKGELSEEEQKLWRDCANSLFIASNPTPAKRVLFERGDIKTKLMRAPLSDRDLVESNVVMESDKKVKTWAKNWR